MIQLNVNSASGGTELKIPQLKQQSSIKLQSTQKSKMMQFISVTQFQTLHQIVIEKSIHYPSAFY